MNALDAGRAARVTTSTLSLAAVAGLLGLFMGLWAGEGHLRFLLPVVLGTVLTIAFLLGTEWLLALVVLVSPLSLWVSVWHYPATWLMVGLLATVALGTLGSHRSVARLRDVRLARAAVVLSIGFVLSAWLSVALGSKNRADVAYGPTAISITMGVVLFWTVVALVDSERKMRIALAAWCAASAMLTTLAMVAYFLPSVGHLSFLSAGGQSLAVGGTSYLRLYSALGDYELFAEMSAITAVAAMSQVADSQGRRRGLWIAVVLLAAVGAVATGTRGGMIVLLLGMTLLWVSRRTPAVRSRLTVWCSLLVVVGVAFSFAVPVLGSVKARFGAITTSGSFAADINRGGIWPQFLPHFGLNNGFLIGFGANFNHNAWATLPHSLYVYVLSTQGVVGLCLMCALLAVLITPFIKTLLGRSVWSLASLLGLMLLLFAVDEIKVEFLRIYNYQLVIWSMFGIAVAAQRLPGRAAISRAAPAARIGPDAGRLL